MTSKEKIEQAFLQLSFAIKLLTYFELNYVIKEQFDSETTIQLKRKNINLPSNTFQTYNDLLFAAENNFNITVGATAIIMDESLSSAGIIHSSNDLTTNGQLRSLIYMIRCAFAHNMIQPIWQVKPDYRREFRLTLLKNIIVIKLNELHGKPFKMEQIGGHDVYWEIKDQILKMIP